MKRKILAILVVLSVMIVFFAGCDGRSMSEKFTDAKDKIKEQTIAEKDLFYDNGQNFFVVNTTDWSIAMAAAQQWCNENHDKELVFCYPGWSEYDGTTSSVPTAYVFYYEDREEK